jgi:hypothetical protein
LIEPFQVRQADLLRIGLEERPDGEYPQMVGAKGGDCVEIALDRICIPIIPAGPQLCEGV